MTDRITALRALEAAMVKGKSRATYIRDLAVEAGMSWDNASTLANAYDGLPTSAFASLRELVPGWRLHQLAQTVGEWHVDLYRREETGRLPSVSAYEYEPDSARVMSIAIVRALIWEAENT